MTGNVEQQVNLQKIHGQFVMDMNLNANQLPINQPLANNGPTTGQPSSSHDASTHTYDLNDVVMKSV